MNKKKAGYGFRIVIGGYLAWLGASILYQMINEKPSNMAVMCVSAVVFIVVGGGYAIFSIKKVLDLRKEEMREAQGNPGDSGVEDGAPDTVGSSSSARQIDLNSTVVKSTPDAEQNPGADPEAGSEDKTEGTEEKNTESTDAESKSTVTEGDTVPDEVPEEIESDYEEK